MGASPDHDHVVPAKTFKDIGAAEILTLAPLAIFTIWIGVHPDPVFDIVRPAVESLLAPFGGRGL
jgi:NADH:ubiquinone oxidoreductase subunit 4 (subunit M)